MSKPKITMRSITFEDDVYVRRDDIARFLTDKAEGIERTEIEQPIDNQLRHLAGVALIQYANHLRGIRDQIETIGTSR